MYRRYRFKLGLRAHHGAFDCVLLGITHGVSVLFPTYAGILDSLCQPPIHACVDCGSCFDVLLGKNLSLFMDGMN
jgi:hypothetical protein